jgi:uncharacterized protein HemY
MQALMKGLQAYKKGNYAIALKEFKKAAEQGMPMLNII